MQPRKHAPRWYRLVSRLFARDSVGESVITRTRFDSSPKTVWNHILFFEEVPGRAPFLLRTLLPIPVRTEGRKDCVGAMVRCEYTGGHLVKRITTVKPSCILEFEVAEQRLGIEGCVLTRGGSYQIDTCREESDLVLVTRYLAYLRPRFLWRPLEALLVHQLHRHILSGVSAAIRSSSPAGHPIAENILAHSTGGITCTISRSPSHR